MSLDLRTLLLTATTAVLAPAVPPALAMSAAEPTPSVSKPDAADGQPPAMGASVADGDQTGGSQAGVRAKATAAPEGKKAIVVDSELRCLALNIYHEARSESAKGQEAVAAVTLNRVESKSFPNSVCKVVKQGGQKRHRCQFSWWCDGRSDRPSEPAAWERALELGRESLLGLRDDPTDGALYYHADHVRPSWSRKLQRTARIGDHIFYRPASTRSVKLASADG
jgi:spore germination cell wall hydrolase CwlJ-like protein